MSNAFVKILLLSCVMDAFIPLLLFLYYLTGLDLIFLFKGVSICFLATVFFYHIRSPIKITYASRLFLLFGGGGILYGLAVNGLLYDEISIGRTVSYIYSIIIPLLSISFGISYSLHRNSEKDALFVKYFRFAFILTVLIILIYSILHYMRLIAYWGLGTSIHYYVPFVINTIKPNAYIIALIAVVLSGKRATLINILTQVTIYYTGNTLTSTRHRWMKFLFFILVLSCAGYILYAKGVFSRFEPLFKLDFEDSYILLLAFGGRWEEVIGIVKYMEGHPISWLIGAGAGAGYGWEVLQSNHFEIKNYAHFTPMAYIFRYGLLFTILLYVNFFSILYRKRDQYRDPFYLCFSATTVASFFGANLLIDVMPWFFYGVMSVNNATRQGPHMAK